MDEQKSPKKSLISGFTHVQLSSSYVRWFTIVKESEAYLEPDVSDWLAAWKLHDLMHSPMPDEYRMLERYGHYTGWFAYKALLEKRADPNRWPAAQQRSSQPDTN